MYLLQTHFRGDINDSIGPKCHFRRYVIDIYLNGCKASKGTIKLNHMAGILYYLGNIPINDIDTKITDNTTKTCVDGVHEFLTSDIVINWESKEPIDATAEKKRISRIMMCFSKWGMTYDEISNRDVSDIICAAPDFCATADDNTVNVCGAVYNGVMTYEESGAQDYDSQCEISKVANKPIKDKGNLLSRFAVMADSHIGVRYEWENYDWFRDALKNICEIHKKTPLDFVVQLGDNIDDGYQHSYKTDYSIYLEEIKNLTICDPVNPIENRKEGTIPHYEIQGNHDTSMDTRFFRKKLWYTENKDGEKVAFITFFAKYGGYPYVLFSVCNSYISYRSYGILDDDMIEFVENSIIEAKQNGAKHIVLFNHFGIAQDLGAPILPEKGLGKIANICKKHNIKLYFNGHEHDENFALRTYSSLYDYDVPMTHDMYGVVEIYEKAVKTFIYNTSDNSISRIDELPL